MTSVIQKAVALAKHISPVEIENHRVSLTQVSEQLERGSGILKDLLGIERPFKEKIESELGILKSKQIHLKSIVTLGTHYRLLSSDPLTWRNQDGWPRLVIFSFKSPEFEIKVTGHVTGNHEEVIPREKKRGSTRTLITYEKRQIKDYKFTREIQPELPLIIKSCYSDVFNKLNEMADKRKKSIRLRCQFEGLIPTEVKQKITKASEHFKHLYIVAEPNGFTISESDIIVPRPRPHPDPDPLVVGFDGTRLWLITSFNTTTVEEAMILSYAAESNKNRLLQEAIGTK